MDSDGCAGTYHLLLFMAAQPRHFVLGQCPNDQIFPSSPLPPFSLASSLSFYLSRIFHGDLAGTAGPYDRNVFLCFKNPDAWLPHVEEDDPPKVVSTALKTRKDNITVKNQTQTQRHFMPNELNDFRLSRIAKGRNGAPNILFMHDLRGKARREEATWPGGGACCCWWSVVRMVVHGGAAGGCRWSCWWLSVELLVVVGGAAGDPLQLLEKAEKQRWMLIASVAFGWGRVEATMCSNIIREVGAERCMIYVEKQEEKK
ncbi:hypothetical protein NC651_012901 [Populus alba x Populus x berolinensis]|nr:hypothetical protein NC651_012901 [Populus alba x Populus x berolinensis]